MSPICQPLQDVEAHRCSPALRLSGPLHHACQAALEPCGRLLVPPALLFYAALSWPPISLKLPLCFNMELPSTPLLCLLRPCESDRNRVPPQLWVVLQPTTVPSFCSFLNSFTCLNIQKSI
jgi:hypothetical protein